MCYWYGNDGGPAEPFVGGGPDLRPIWGGPALLFRWPPSYLQPPHIVPQPYLSSAAAFTCPGMAAKDGWQVLPTGLLWEMPTNTAPGFLTTHELGHTGYWYAYVPPLTPAITSTFRGYAGVGRRDSIRGRDAGRTSIFADECLMAVVDATTDARFTNFHDARGGGNVLYLDGHATWWDGTTVRRAAAAAVGSTSSYVRLVNAVDR